jgi:Tfp pilus assembly protein PilF
MKRKSYILILGFLLGCSSNSKNDNEESKTLSKSEIFFNEGTLNLYEKKYTAALNNLLKAYKLSPQDDKIINNLAMSYFFKNNVEKAEKLLVQAREINPDNFDVQMNLGFIYIETDQLKKAHQIYNDLSRSLNFEYQYRTYYNLGVIAYKQKDNRNALSYFEKSIKENESYCPSLFWKARIYYDKQDFRKALTHFKESVKGSCYGTAQSHYYLALTHLKLNQVSDARMKLNHIIESYPRTDVALKSQSLLFNLRKSGESDQDFITQRHRQIYHDPENIKENDERNDKMDKDNFDAIE